MLSHLIRAQLAAEFLAYAALGVWLHETRGWSVAAIALLVVVAVPATRLAIVCVSSLIAFAVRSPREPAQQLGVLGTLRLLMGEWRAMLLSNFWRLPFVEWAVRPDPLPRRGGPTPVLLVHGYVSNRGMLLPLLRGLDRAGVAQAFTLDFRGIFCPVDDLVGQLEARVDEILAATGHAKLVIVAHSLGGLVTRLALVRPGTLRVAHLVTIASPHHGTALAALGRGHNARQMQRNSAFLNELAAAEAARGTSCAITSIYSVHDNLVAPQDTSRLPGARNVALHGWGHVAVVGAPDTLEHVLDVLRREGAA